MSMATLLSQRHEVVAVDVVPAKVEMINRRESPIMDEYVEKYLAGEDAAGRPVELRLKATLDGRAAYRDADFVIIATPTNYDPKKNFFDTSHVEEVIETVLEVNPDAVMVIKSTVPVGYTRGARERFAYRERLADGTMRVVTPKIVFSPEFLRESRALYDNLYPSRIIVGCDDGGAAQGRNGGGDKVSPSIPGEAKASLRQAAEAFAGLLREASLNPDVPVLIMGSTEA